MGGGIRSWGKRPGEGFLAETHEAQGKDSEPGVYSCIG